MGDPALELARASAANEPSWGLRLAQQVFAALLEHGRRYSSFRVAAHRQRARAGLRGLSVDDRGQLERWICLLWRSRHGEGLAQSGRALGLIDANLANAIGRCMPCAAQAVRHGTAGMEIAA